MNKESPLERTEWAKRTAYSRDTIRGALQSRNSTEKVAPVLRRKGGVQNKNEKRISSFKQSKKEFALFYTCSATRKKFQISYGLEEKLGC